MVDQHNHNVPVVGSSPTISSIQYNSKIKIQGTNLGYYYFIDKNHPLATGNSGRVLLHRHVAQLKLGRWLLSNEIVHHIDENKLNNSPDNLLVLSRQEHSSIHAIRLEQKPCIECGNMFTPKESKILYCTNLCSKKSQIKNKDITKELLEQLMPTHSWIVLGKLFGYQDNGIKKRAVSLGCDMSLKTKPKAQGNV